MHYSNDRNLRPLSVTCYLDESATDGDTPIAVVGGLLVNSSHFVGLDEKWRAMLDEFHLWPGLHLKDFGQHGKFAKMLAKERAAIFSRAGQIIKDHSICTIAVTVEHAKYREILARNVKGTMSPYGLAFIACVLGNRIIAKQNEYDKKVDFVIDAGNPYAEHVLWAHQAIIVMQTEEYFLNLGSLTFDTDDNVTALQAADIVCWAVRRRATGYPFSNGFEPLENILDHQAHNQSPFPEVAMRDLLAQLEALNPAILKKP